MPMPTLQSLAQRPNALAKYYRLFRVSERLLLTGHSHQAWPDCAYEGQIEAFQDASLLCDEKWERAFEKAEIVRRGYAKLLGTPEAPDTGAITLGENTFELIVRLFSALPWTQRPKVVTTDGEFHSLRRLLARMGEAGIEVVRVPSQPAGEIASALAQAVDEHTAIVCVSAVLFQTADIVPNLRHALRAAEHAGAEFLIDAYHALNVLPFCLNDQGLQDAYVVGGGYKYCQFGEGNCFLRAPHSSQLRPIATGWFSELNATMHGKTPETTVHYATGPDRFAGSTYDPTSNYRAASVLNFFEEQSLTPKFLREVSQRQLRKLIACFDALDLPAAIIQRDMKRSIEDTAGFLALKTPHASSLMQALRLRKVFVDCRGDVLRVGAAPYLSDQQLEDAVYALGESAHALRRFSP